MSFAWDQKQHDATATTPCDLYRLELHVHWLPTCSLVSLKVTRTLSHNKNRGEPLINKPNTISTVSYCVTWCGQLCFNRLK